MKAMDVFEEYIKHYTPKFSGGSHLWCSGRYCNNCACENMCEELTECTLEEIEEIREKYPEYFV